jgi:hypothetical protein
MLTQTVNDRKMLNDKVYAFGKKLTQVILPAFATLYFALASMWGLPSPEKVLGTTAAITTFIGVTLGLSSKQYDASGAAYDGTVKVIANAEGAAVHFNLDPQDLVHKDSVTFKVEPPPPL